MLAKDDDKACYGKLNVKKALDYSAVEMLLISEDLDDKLADEFIEKIEETGSTYELISTDTNEGTQLKEIGGVAAILRYPLN